MFCFPGKYNFIDHGLINNYELELFLQTTASLVASARVHIKFCIDAWLWVTGSREINQIMENLDCFLKSLDFKVK